MIAQITLGVIIAAAEPTGMLALACQGTTTFMAPIRRSEPVSMGIIINFADKTVQGFTHPVDFPVKITGISDTMIVFSGQGPSRPNHFQINGSIDQVTGGIETTTDLTSDETSTLWSVSSLKCRPTQRMF